MKSRKQPKNSKSLKLSDCEETNRLLHLFFNSPQYKKAHKRGVKIWRKKRLRDTVIFFYLHAGTMLIYGAFSYIRPPSILTNYLPIEILITFYLALNVLFVVYTHRLNETRSVNIALILLFLTSIFIAYILLSLFEYDIQHDREMFFYSFLWAIMIAINSFAAISLAVKLHRDSHTNLSRG